MKFLSILFVLTFVPHSFAEADTVTCTISSQSGKTRIQSVEIIAPKTELLIEEQGQKVSYILLNGEQVIQVEGGMSMHGQAQLGNSAVASFQRNGVSTSIVCALDAVNLLGPIGKFILQRTQLTFIAADAGQLMRARTATEACLIAGHLNVRVRIGRPTVGMLAKYFRDARAIKASFDNDMDGIYQECLSATPNIDRLREMGIKIGGSAESLSLLFKAKDPY